jgi:hypothetical protein
MWSDQKIKTNIHSFTHALNSLRSLNPVTYYYNTSNVDLNLDNNKLNFGLIAQEVEPIFPDMVSEMIFPAKYDEQGNMISDTVHIKGVSYIQLIPVLIQGIQELDSVLTITTDKLNNIIQDYDQRLNDLEQMILNCCGTVDIPNKTNPEPSFTQTVTVSNQRAIVLNQNSPNPFKEQSTITFVIPDFVKSAQIVFIDNLGNILNQVDITERGHGELIVYAQDLSSGLYTYYLVADGKTIDSKKMVVAK